jgi:hypothetical protein
MKVFSYKVWEFFNPKKTFKKISPENGPNGYPEKYKHAEVKEFSLKKKKRKKLNYLGQSKWENCKYKKTSCTIYGYFSKTAWIFAIWRFVDIERDVAYQMYQSHATFDPLFRSRNTVLLFWFHTVLWHIVDIFSMFPALLSSSWLLWNSLSGFSHLG